MASVEIDLGTYKTTPAICSKQHRKADRPRKDREIDTYEVLLRHTPLEICSSGPFAETRDIEQRSMLTHCVSASSHASGIHASVIFSSKQFESGEGHNCCFYELLEQPNGTKRMIGRGNDQERT